MDPRERLTQLFREHWGAVFGYAGRRCASDADAADVVSEVFLTVWRRIEDVPPGDQARLWLYGVAHRVVANQRRGLRRRGRLGSALLAELHAAGRDGDGDFTGWVEQSVAVQAALGALSVIDREVLQLVGWEQLTPVEVARVLEITPAAARVRLSRARAHLAKLLPSDLRSVPQAVAEPEG